MSNFDAFEANITGRSWSNAWLLSLASLYVYENQVGVPSSTPNSRRWNVFKERFRRKFGSRDWGMDDFGFHRSVKRGTDCVVMSNSSAVIVVFRGTEANMTDWITNVSKVYSMRLVRSWGYDVRVHGGWYNAIAGTIYTRVRDDIKGRMNGRRRLWITGHSLGGVLSVLLAYKLWKQDKIEAQGVHTYGAPMVGNNSFGKVYAPFHQKTQQWVNDGDPVPLLPCDNRTGGCVYRHVGITNNIYRGGQIKLNDHQRYYAPDVTTAAHSIPRYSMLIHSRLPSHLKRRFRDPLG